MVTLARASGDLKDLPGNELWDLYNTTLEMVKYTSGKDDFDEEDAAAVRLLESRLEALRAELQERYYSPSD